MKQNRLYNYLLSRMCRVHEKGRQKSYHILDLLFNEDFKNMKQENKGTMENG